MDESRSISVTPSVQVLSLLQNMNYTPWFSLGEFVDNSITSYLKYVDKNPKDTRFDTLQIRISWDVSQQRMVILDNAAGIPNSASGWTRALELGSPNPDPSLLGVYGYGMKAAAFWWSPRMTIRSKVVDETVVRSVDMDLPKIQEGGIASVPLIETETGKLEEHFTEIVLLGINQGRSYPTGMTLDKVRKYLASMYRIYLRGDKGFSHPRTGEPFLEIYIQDKKLEAYNPELLKEPYWDKDTPPTDGRKSELWKKSFKFELPNKDKSINKGRPLKITGWAGVLKVMSHDAGLFLSFRGKGLAGIGQGTSEAAQDTYKPTEIYGRGNTWRKQRLIAEIDLSAFGKLNTSNDVKWSDAQREAFEVQLKEVLKDLRVSTMAENFRINRKDGYSNSQQKVLQDAVQGSADLAALISSQSDINVVELETEEIHKLPKSTQRFLSKTNWKLQDGYEIFFSANLGAPTQPWLSLYIDDDAEKANIEINNNHPFMQKYFLVPKNDPSGVFQIGIGIALAEIQNRSLGTVRHRVNRHLDLANNPDALTIFNFEEEIGD